MTTQTQVKETMEAARSEEIPITFLDDLGNDVGKALVDRSMTIADLQGEAAAFGLPEGEYALYPVKQDGGEAPRLDARSTVGECFGEAAEATVRFGPELVGAV